MRGRRRTTPGRRVHADPVTIVETTIYLVISLWLTLDATVGTGGALLILAVTITGMGAVIATIVHRSR